MSTHYRRVVEYFRHALGTRGAEEAAARLKPRHDPASPHVPGGSVLSEEAIWKRWELLALPASSRAELADPRTLEQRVTYEHSVENFIGTVKVPVGLAGPLRVNGLHANGDFYVPLATTEAALVASYSRGSQIVTEAGGCAVLVLNEGVSRAPGFAFETLGDAATFVAWASGSFDDFKTVAQHTTRHGQLVDMQLTIEGNHVYVSFEFMTGDASGQK